MKVSELIAALSHFDPNLDVVNAAWDSYEPNDLTHVGASLVFDREKPAIVKEPLSPGAIISRSVMTEAGDKPSPPLEVTRTDPDAFRVPSGGGVAIPVQRGPFKEGALVCLKIGGPLMAVEDIRSDGIVGTVWIVDGEVHRDGFHPAHLFELVLA